MPRAARCEWIDDAAEVSTSAQVGKQARLNKAQLQKHINYLADEKNLEEEDFEAESDSDALSENERADVEAELAIGEEHDDFAAKELATRDLEAERAIYAQSFEEEEEEDAEEEEDIVVIARRSGRRVKSIAQIEEEEEELKRDTVGVKDTEHSQYTEDERRNHANLIRSVSAEEDFNTQIRKHRMSRPSRTPLSRQLDEEALARHAEEEEERNEELALLSQPTVPLLPTPPPASYEAYPPTIAKSPPVVMHQTNLNNFLHKSDSTNSHKPVELSPFRRGVPFEVKAGEYKDDVHAPAPGVWRIVTVEPRIAKSAKDVNTSHFITCQHQDTKCKDIFYLTTGAKQPIWLSLAQARQIEAKIDPKSFHARAKQAIATHNTGPSGELIMSPGLHQEEMEKRDKEKRNTPERPGSRKMSQACVHINKVVLAGVRNWIQEEGRDNVCSVVVSFMSRMNELGMGKEDDADAAFQQMKAVLERDIRNASDERAKQAAQERKMQVFHMLLCSVMFDKAVQREIFANNKAGGKRRGPSTPRQKSGKKKAKSSANLPTNDEEMDSDSD